MRALLVTLIYASLVSHAYATPAVTAAPTMMREQPSRHARVVQVIPANAQIDVEGCGRHWCNASWRDISGFISVDAIEAGGPMLRDAPPPPSVSFGPPVFVAPFAFGYYGQGWRRHY